MTTAATQAAARNLRKTQVGVVVSNKMQKTIVVRVERSVRHRLYGRVIKQATSFKAHDATNTAKIGDLVRIMETRPLSRDKRWRLVEVVQRASTAPPVPGTEEQTARRAPGKAASQEPAS